MKKNLILGIMCLLSLNVAAQFSFGDASLTGKKWTKGDFAFGKEAVWVFRYDYDALKRVRNTGKGDYRVADALLHLQEMLDTMKARIRRYEPVPFLYEARLYLDTIRRLDLNFNLYDYKTEHEAYANFARKMPAWSHEELISRRAADSLRHWEFEEEKRIADLKKQSGNNRAVAGHMLIRSYTDLPISEQTFKAVFGSVAAYNLQVSIRHKSRHGQMILYTGAKAIWAIHVAVYMTEELGCSREIYANDEIMPTHFVINQGATWGDMDTTSVYIDFTTDDSMRITKGVIKGNPMLLRRLFTRYWYQANGTVSNFNLSKGHEVHKDYVSDRITFNWKGAKPYITITRNPAFSVPWPILEERKQ